MQPAQIIMGIKNVIATMSNPSLGLAIKTPPSHLHIKQCQEHDKTYSKTKKNTLKHTNHHGQLPPLTSLLICHNSRVCAGKDNYCNPSSHSTTSESCLRIFLQDRADSNRTDNLLLLILYGRGKTRSVYSRKTCSYPCFAPLNVSGD